jgi:hypothetical protein
VELNLLGRYWEEDECWMAQVLCLGLETSAATPYMSLLRILEKIEFKCSISVVDKGVFYLHSNEDQRLRELITSKILEMKG